MPVNVHRANLLWYNKSVLAANGLAESDLSSFKNWESAAKKLQAAGVTPLAFGDHDSWASAYLFEMALLGALDTDEYKGFGMARRVGMAPRLLWRWRITK